MDKIFCDSIYTQSILRHSAGAAIADARYSQTGNFMLICDAEYVHIWRFGGDGADAAFPAHELRVKSQGARCIALTGAHHHDAAQAAWGCADGRVNFYDAAAQTHALYIPAQPLRTPPGAKGGASPICAMCFVFSRLVLCGDESGELFLVEFGLEGPQVLQAIEVHNKRYQLSSPFRKLIFFYISFVVLIYLACFCDVLLITLSGLQVLILGNKGQ